jgi:hypothetical protein
MREQRMGLCPVCRAWERTYADGTIATHPPREHDDTFYEECSGTRFAPLETMPLVAGEST